MEARLSARQPTIAGREAPAPALAPVPVARTEAKTNGTIAVPASAEASEAIDEPEAATAAATATATPAPGNSPDETNVWPDEAAEAAFLAEARGRGESTKASEETARETADDNGEGAKALPKLDDLVNRIPAETRELLEELFRARFTAVRRVKKTELKG